MFGDKLYPMNSFELFIIRMSPPLQNCKKDIFVLYKCITSDAYLLCSDSWQLMSEVRWWTLLSYQVVLQILLLPTDFHSIWEYKYKYTYLMYVSDGYRYFTLSKDSLCTNESIFVLWNFIGLGLQYGCCCKSNIRSTTSWSCFRVKLQLRGNC